MEIDSYYSVSAAVCMGTDETLHFIELKGMRFIRDTGDYLWFQQDAEEPSQPNRTYAIERNSIIDLEAV